MVEAVGHADGDLDPVVEGLELGVGVAQLDRAQDVRPAASDLLRRFDDLGVCVNARPGTPSASTRPGLFERVLSRVLNSSLSCHER